MACTCPCGGGFELEEDLLCTFFIDQRFPAGIRLYFGEEKLGMGQFPCKLEEVFLRYAGYGE